MANNVTVNFTQNIATTDPLGAGFVCTEFNGNPVPIVGDATWNAALAALGVGHIRFSLAWYGGNPSYGAGGSPGQQGSGGSAATALLNAVKNMGAIPLVSFNGNTADNNFNPADGGSIVHFFNDNGGQHGGRIQYWSIGNEPEFSGGTGIYQSASGQGSASATLAAMHAADNTINIGIPTAGHWDAPLLQWSAGVANIGTMSYHAYDGQNTDDSSGQAYPNGRQLYNHMKNDMPSYKAGINYGIEEFNWHSSYNNQNQFYTATNTCFIADNIGMALSAGGHATLYGDSNNALGMMNDGSNQNNMPGAKYTKFPSYWGLGIWTGMNGQFKKYGAHFVSATTTLAFGTLSVYATDSNKIIIVNKSGSSQAVQIGVTLPGGVTSGSYNVWKTQNAGTPPGAISKDVSGAGFSGGTISYTVPATTVVSIDITPNGSPSNTVTVTNPGSQSSVAGSAITALQINATDSAAGQTLTYTASSLPPGLSIGSSTGQITGTPTTQGTYTPTVTATDTTSASGSTSFTWTITPATGNTITVTNPGPQNSVQSTAISTLQIVATDSASGQTLSYASSGLPAGLSINSSTGAITGTPTTATSYTPTVTVSDTSPTSSSVTFSWVISPSGSPGTTTLLSNDFNEGTNGTGITTGNSGGGVGESAFDSVTTTNSATAVYSNVAAVNSGLSGAFSTSGVSGVAMVTWSTSLGTQSTIYGRVLVYMQSYPAADDNIVEFRNGATFGGGVMIATSGQLRTQNASFGEVGGGPTVPLNTWTRIEFKLVCGGAGVGSLNLNYYSTSDSVTITQSVTDNAGAFGSSSAINTINYGRTSNHASQPAVYLDGLNVNLQGYPGPATTVQVLLVNNCESGAALGGQTVSPSNSGSAVANAFDGVVQSPIDTQTANPFPGFFPSAAAHGTTGIAFTTAYSAAPSAASVFWSTSLGFQATVYGRVYVYLGAFPSTTDQIVQFLSAGTAGGGIAVSVQGHLLLQNATGGQTDTGVILPVGQWFRLEWLMVGGPAGTGSLTLNYYASMDSVTVTSTTTDNAGAYGSGAKINQVSFGWNTPNTNQPVMNMDDFGLSTTGYLGPAGHPVTGALALQTPAFPTTGNNATDTNTFFYNTFEGGTNGTTITTGNSGGTSGHAFDAVTITNGSLTFSSTQSAHGSLAAAMSTTVSTGQVANFSWNTIPLTTTMYGRVYVYLTASPITTDANIQFRGTGASNGGSIQIDTGRHLVLQNGVFTTILTFSTVLATATWYRIEWYMATGTAGNASFTVTYYAGDSQSAIESHTDQTSAWGGTGGIAEMDFGWTHSHPSQPTMYMDDIALSPLNYLGPAGKSASGSMGLQPFILSSNAADRNTTETATGSYAMQPMTFSGRAATGAQPFVYRFTSGNVVNDYGLDNVPYTISSTGTTTGLVAFIGWNVSPFSAATAPNKSPAVNVTDSAGNLWRQIGITPAQGVSRSSIWFCDNPRQVSWISVALTGWAYATSYTIAEIQNLPSSFGLPSIDFVSTTVSTAGVASLTIPSGTATGSDLVFGILSTGGGGGALTVPSGWSGIAAAGGALSAQATTYSMYIPNRAAGTVPFAPTWANTVPASGIIVGLKLTAPAPAQPNPNFPRVVVEAAFGATPGDWTQSTDYTWDINGLTWTDITSRVIGDKAQGRIKIGRGRQYEIAQEETGEMTISLDNHDGVFTYGNTSSPYYPNVVPGVPVRVTAWWNGTQYPVGFGYVERWPQEWPDMPQWGFSTLVATDAYGPLANTSLASAVEGDIRKDSPYAYFATDEQYSFTTQSLSPTKAPIDANGLTAINKAPGNNRIGAYRDGQHQPVTAGQALNLLGDSDTVMGAATYIAPETNASGPGMFYFDPNIPTNTTGMTLEFWFTWGGTTLASTTLLNAWAGPSSFYAAAPSIGTVGGVITVGVNTGSNTAKATGFYVNGTEIGAALGFNQNTFAPQHFVLVTGPTGLYAQSLSCYLNGVGVGVSNGIATHPLIRAVTLGPARFAYDVSDLCVYNGFNFTAGHLAIYPYELTPTQISNHFASGFYGSGYIPAPGRFAQALTWALLGLKRGGTAWYGTYGNVENTFMSEAYSYEGSTAADVMHQLTQTEGGRCFTQANGSLVYVIRWAQYNQPVVATFGDNGTTELPFMPDSSFSVDNSFIYNQVNATQNRGPDQTFFYQVTDQTSQTDYFNRSGLQVQSYALTPFDVDDVVNWSVAKYRQPVQRSQVLSLDVAASQGKFPALFPTVLGLELNKTVTVNRRPVGGAVISVTGAIQQIQHDIGPSQWLTHYQISPVYPENQALIADQPGQNTPGTQSLSW